MKLLFIQGGSRWKTDTDGNIYTDSNFNNIIWHRYKEYCDDLTVMLRKEETVYSVEEARNRFNPFDPTIAHYYMLPDVYRPVKNAFNLKLRREIAQKIKQEVQKADKIIIRSIGTYYTDTALTYARKFQKPHLVEVTGFSWEAYWYHSLRGKFYAFFNEIQCRRLLKDVPYAVYVTEDALQKRYPNKGRSIGCSDVELQNVNIEVLERRKQRIINHSDQSKVVIGTAAFLDVGWKGQKHIIKALSELKKRGITNIEYQLVGSGTGEDLLKTAEDYQVRDQVKILGTLPHDKVFQWMDSLDIYVQPSFMEGLCRAIVEAMSRGCPVIASDVGGNYELISREYLFRKGDSSAFAEKLQRMLDKAEQLKEAEKNFEHARKFNKAELDQKRNAFYREFMNA